MYLLLCGSRLQELPREPWTVDPEDFQRMHEAMPNIGTVRSFDPVEREEVNPPETTVYIEGNNGGVRFPVDAVRAEDLAEMFDDLADELTVEE